MINTDLNQMQYEVGEWGKKTFPDSTLATITAHLQEEAEELQALCTPQPPGEGMAETDVIAEEAADCLLLLLHVAHREGFSLCDAARRKMAVNIERTWDDDPNGRGYQKHTEEPPDDR